MASRHHDLPYSEGATAFVSYYERCFNQACASGVFADFLGLHAPQATVSRVEAEGVEEMRPASEFIGTLPKGATLHFVDPRGDKARIIAGFHGYGWPVGDVVGHATFDLTDGMVTQVHLDFL